MAAQSKGRWSYITSGAGHSQKGDVSKLFIFRPLTQPSYYLLDITHQLWGELEREGHLS